MDDYQIVLLRKIHYFFKEIKFHHGRCRVVGKVDEEYLRPGPALLVGFLKVFEKVPSWSCWYTPYITSGNDYAVCVYGIGGVGDQHQVAWTYNGQCKV